jgi:hypothetical protein
MASLFEDASLVMIPSGYKDGKVYSIKPTNGDGDLTFTRSNDTATRVGPDGLIEKVRTNLALYSEDLTDAVYAKIDVTVTANTTTAPDGTLTADTITADAPLATLQAVVSVVGGSNYKMSVYLKRKTGTGTISLRGVSNISTAVTITNDWARYSITLNSPDTVGRYGVRIDTSGDEVYAWGFQLEVTGDSPYTGLPTDYIATTTAAVSVGPVANVPRLDYLDSSCPKLLLEPQRQNVCLWSEQIDNAGWIKINGPTITTNIATAPDGYGGADGIQDTTGGTFKRIGQLFSVTANSTNTASVFVKKETTQTNFGGLTLTYTGSTTKYAYGIVNPIAGTIVVSSDSVIGATSTKVEDYGDWWRFSLTATDNGSNTTLEIAYYGTLSTNGTSAGLAAGSVRTVWGFQAEDASYATSYIPTLSAASTRGADAALKTASLFNQTNFSIFFDYKAINGEGGSAPIFGLTETAGNDFEFYVNGENGLNVYVSLGGGYLFGTSPNAGFTIGSQSKVLVTYNGTTLKYFINGVLYGSAALSLPFTSRTLFFTGYKVTLTSQMLFFPITLTDAECIELTTI